MPSFLTILNLSFEKNMQKIIIYGGYLYQI